MITYKTELHCHTNPGSACAHLTPEEVVEKYIDCGYTTLCITNHFTPFNKMEDRDSWLREIAIRYDVYDRAVRAARGRLNVIFGLEMRFVQHSNDYLVFGIDRDRLENIGCAVLKDGIGAYHDGASERGEFVIQAHPFRHNMTVIRPQDVDAYEVFNGHPKHDSRNFIAEQWARRYSKPMTSGTDHHDPDHIPNGGIRTTAPITTAYELIDTLRSGRYDLIRENPYNAAGIENHLG